MASPPRWPPLPGGTPPAGDAKTPPSVQAAASRTLLVAQDVAEATLADAERLAVGLLAEAQRQADGVLGQARESASRLTEETRRSIENMFQARHDEVLVLVTECRDELRAVLTSSRPDADQGHGQFAGSGPASPSAGGGKHERAGVPALQAPIQVQEPAAPGQADEQEAPARLRSVAGKSPVGTVDGTVISKRREDSDEEYFVALFDAIFGEEPMKPLWSDGADTRATTSVGRREAIRLSAGRAAERAAAEREAMQTEALQRRAAERNRTMGDRFGVVSGMHEWQAKRNDAVVAPAGRRSTDAHPATETRAGSGER